MVIYLGDYESRRDEYKSWLDNQAPSSIDNDAGKPELNSSTLNTFQSKIDDYDGWAICMLVSHAAFTVNQQESAGCIKHEDYGTTCAVVTTDDTTSGKEGKSYWFPDTAST